MFKGEQRSVATQHYLFFIWSCILVIGRKRSKRKFRMELRSSAWALERLSKEGCAQWPVAGRGLLSFRMGEFVLWLLHSEARKPCQRAHGLEAL